MTPDDRLAAHEVDELIADRDAAVARAAELARAEHETERLIAERDAALARAEQAEARIAAALAACEEQERTNTAAAPGWLISTVVVRRALGERPEEKP